MIMGSHFLSNSDGVPVHDKSHGTARSPCLLIDGGSFLFLTERQPKFLHNLNYSPRPQVRPLTHFTCHQEKRHQKSAFDKDFLRLSTTKRKKGRAKSRALSRKQCFIWVSTT